MRSVITPRTHRPPSISASTDCAKLLGMPDTRSLKVGDQAPLFTLPSSTGQPVDLAEHLVRGPVVLAWYLFDIGRV
jgi:hypothetical protein